MPPSLANDSEALRMSVQGSGNRHEPESNSMRPVSPFLTRPAAAFGKPICRAGLASRGGDALTADDVLFAVERGVNFLNWPGHADSPGGTDAMSNAVASLGSLRESVVVCAQFGARTAAE